MLRLLPICLSIFLLSACQSRHNLFEKISSSQSGIHFNNSITESDSLNPMNVVNIYNGGGVGIGDFNNDGLQDVYLTGNMVSSKLYLNKGDFKFEDITEEAGAGGLGRWARGVAVTDINNDGLMDIYICNTVYTDSLKRRNILYINQGVNNKGVPQFIDKAAEYGLDINVQSTMAYFFDYDNDGDLDMYLSVNEASSVNENQFGKRTSNTATGKGSKGRLYQNNEDRLVNHPVFRNVSLQADIILDGFGHGATITDINRDGWKDIYVSNDFLSENILFINNHDGTFTNRSKDYFKHTSFNSMGQDIIDINNDGLDDVVELDMNPEDNYRKKMMMPSSNYNTFQNFDIYGTQFQYIRNTLQLNQGPKILENDSIGSPVFSEIGFMSGVAQTDWSWTPVVLDFDNDSYRDMIVTNGFPKDVTDHDFIAYRKSTVAHESPIQMLDKIPEVKLANYAFKNRDGVMFDNVTESWGLSEHSFSNGAACADFDNDGDMDIVINNIDDEAFLYKNNTRLKGDSTTHFLQVKCIGDKTNIEGIGAWIGVYYNGVKQQVYENTPYRGYLSTYQSIAHFGLGKTTLLDSVVIKWPGGKKQTLTKVAADQLLKVNIDDAREGWYWQPSKSNQALFKEVTVSSAVSYAHREQDFIDFNIQTTLPHKLSEYNPALAAGDVDGNGFDDIVIAGNTFNPPTLFFQQPDGKFIQKGFLTKKDTMVKGSKDEGILLFDADNDGDLDLYAASGGYKYDHKNVNYQDILYINDGKGHYAKAKDALPVNYTSKLCVRAFDFNKDGKLDLFVSGRVDPWNYPKPVSSFIFRNDTKNGIVKFTDVTDEVAPELKNIGMVCDALFTDFDNDGQTDLLLTGEWMPLTFLKNENGKFKNVSSGSGINDKSGWWNSIVAGDFRHTGRTDYIVGNAGLNTLYQASDQYPVYCTANDFNNNGSYQVILSLFLKDQKGQLQEFPANGRDAIIERIPALKKQFDNYNKFATATMAEIFPPDKINGAIRLKATMLQSCFIQNDGGGRFTMIPLPQAAQISLVNGMVADDFDGDGNLDVLINGNDYGTEVSIGRFDALNGLLLKGNGKGEFSPLSILQSGIYIPGNGKALVKLQLANGGYLVAASQYRDSLKVFELRRKTSNIKIKPDDIYALIKYADGSTEKREFYYGTSFLSQSARFLTIDENVSSVEIADSRGIRRKISID